MKKYVGVALEFILFPALDHLGQEESCLLEEAAGCMVVP